MEPEASPQLEAICDVSVAGVGEQETVHGRILVTHKTRRGVRTLQFAQETHLRKCLAIWKVGPQRLAVPTFLGRITASDAGKKSLLSKFRTWAQRLLIIWRHSQTVGNVKHHGDPM